jgi:hypothetical protein
VTEMYHVALVQPALRAAQVRLKSISNEVLFTLDAKRVFRPYLPSLCSWVTEI